MARVVGDRSAQMSARGHRADEDVRVRAVLAHAHSIAEHRTADQRLDGSTATTPTRRPRASSSPSSACTSVDLPAPGAPVIPSTCARPRWARAPRARRPPTAPCSMRLMARATAWRRPGAGRQRGRRRRGRPRERRRDRPGRHTMARDVPEPSWRSVAADLAVRSRPRRPGPRGRRRCRSGRRPARQAVQRALHVGGRSVAPAGGKPSTWACIAARSGRVFDGPGAGVLVHPVAFAPVRQLAAVHLTWKRRADSPMSCAGPGPTRPPCTYPAPASSTIAMMRSISASIWSVSASA